ncbi:MAG TPA: BON domain-containing protein [Flavisolibacter sp.]|jgi:hypothetical protein|nr:BON domain-containing protein [Flavisolibacter sp.]
MKCLIFSLLLMLMLGCSQSEKDKDIKQTIASTARDDVAFAAVNYTVREGVVTLGGKCPTQQEKEKVLKRVNGTTGVKGVLDLIQVAPVTLTSDFSLKQATDSVLMKYATVEANVQDSVITLHGEVEKERLPHLLKALGELGAKGVNHHLADK